MEAYSLYEVNQYIRRVLALNFEEPFWVECEINQVSNSRGNMYLDLIEKEENGLNIIAKSPATIWYKQFLFIKKKLGKLTSSILDSGIKVKLKVTVEYSERYGMSLNILDIDPSYTFGQFELNRQKIISQLQEKGLIDKNSELELPKVIQKIAVISSETAAGYQDFIQQIMHNGYGYDFGIDLYPAAMQGQNTEREVVNSIREASEYEYDVIAIIRGGGSKLDLSSFDNYNIAHTISQIDIPVVTGIGHDIDNTVTDIVAHTVLKTPTAVADFIIDHNVVFESEILHLSSIISQTISRELKEEYFLLERFQNQITHLPQKFINNEKTQLNSTEIHLNSAFSFVMNKHKWNLEKIEETLALLSPQNILKRGFSLIKQDNKYIRRKNEFKKSGKTKIEFFDGDIEI